MEDDLALGRASLSRSDSFAPTKGQIPNTGIHLKELSLLNRRYLYLSKYFRPYL
jgi:hypothetical protein